MTAQVPCACGNAFTSEPRIHCERPGEHKPSPSPTCVRCHGPLMAWCPGTDDAGPVVPCVARERRPFQATIDRWHDAIALAWIEERLG